MITSGQGYEIDGKLCYSAPDDVLKTTEKDIYVAFMDRCYSVQDTAIIALAVCRASNPFGILGFVNGAVLELNSDPPIVMANLLTFAQQQICHAFSTRRNLPDFEIQEELSIPEGYAALGDRQLNEILSNTRYHIRRRYTHNSLHEQFDASRAFRSTSDVRDAPGGSRGRSMPVQPSEPPTRPKARPRTESVSGPNVRQRPRTPRGTVRPGSEVVYDNLGSQLTHAASARPLHLHQLRQVGQAKGRP